jgi:transposase
MFSPNKLFEDALGIKSPWSIKEVKFDEKKQRLDIYIDFQKGAEFYYEDEESGIKGTFKAYDTIDKTWRHLNFFQHEAYIHARVPRIKIDDNKTRRVKSPWEGVKSGFTLLFEAFILQLAVHMPVNVVSKITGVSNYKLWNILGKYIDAALEANDYSEITAIGLDETSAKKGHSYISLFVDLNKRRTIFIAEGKDRSTIKAFKKDLIAHNGDPKNIKDVSCDMSPAFISGVAEYLPDAKITFDKFHIMKLINTAVDNVRREEQQGNPLFKNTRYIFLKNEKNLTNHQREKLSELKLSKIRLKSVRALSIRESFQDIYRANSTEEFEQLLKKWYFWATHSRLYHMKKVAKTIKAHWDGIVRWKDSQINNGILEGLNSVIQAAKSKARGFSTLKNYKIMAYLVTADLNFSKLNKYYLPTV